jgi:transcriptional regulator with XRE-family HTH domain
MLRGLLPAITIMEQCAKSCPTTNAAQAARFPGNLAYWRLKRQLSQKQAADKLGVAKSTWSQWESGKRTPSIFYLPLLGQVLQVPWCALLSPNREICAKPG